MCFDYVGKAVVIDGQIMGIPLEDIPEEDIPQENDLQEERRYPKGIKSLCHRKISQRT